MERTTTRGLAAMNFAGFEGTFIRKSLNSAEPLFEVDVPPGIQGKYMAKPQELLGEELHE